MDKRCHLVGHDHPPGCCGSTVSAYKLQAQWARTAEAYALAVATGTPYVDATLPDNKRGVAILMGLKEAAKLLGASDHTPCWSSIVDSLETAYALLKERP